MANVIWRGDAPAIAQVDTVQITAMSGTPSDTTYKLTINGKIVSVPGDTDESTTAAALSAAWNLSAFPEFAEVTASVATDTVTLTADTAGKPFTVASSVAGGTGTIGAVTNATASAGPNHWDTALNWLGGAVPVDTNDVWLDNNNVDIKYGLDQTGVALATLNISASYIGKIGIPETNIDGSIPYDEYRATYLDIEPTIINVGQGVGGGSGRIKWEQTDAGASTLNVYKTGGRADTDRAPLIVKPNTAGSIINNIDGDIEIAPLPGETATVTTLNNQGTVSIGDGVSGLVSAKNNGNLTSLSDITALTNYRNGRSTALASVVITTLTNFGTHVHNSDGTITTFNSHGALDAGKDLRSFTVTTLNQSKGSRILDPFNRMAVTNYAQAEPGTLSFN